MGWRRELQKHLLDGIKQRGISKNAWWAWYGRSKINEFRIANKMIVEIKSRNPIYLAKGNNCNA